MSKNDIVRKIRDLATKYANSEIVQRLDFARLADEIEGLNQEITNEETIGFNIEWLKIALWQNGRAEFIASHCLDIYYLARNLLSSQELINLFKQDHQNNIGIHLAQYLGLIDTQDNETIVDLYDLNSNLRSADEEVDNNDDETLTNYDSESDSIGDNTVIINFMQTQNVTEGCELFNDYFSNNR